MKLDQTKHWTYQFGKHSFKFSWFTPKQHTSGKMISIEKLTQNSIDERQLSSFAFFILKRKGRWGMGHYFRTQEQIKIMSDGE